jgi:hypothetical protein
MWRKRNPATVTWLSTAALHLQSCLNLSLAPVFNLASCLRELQVAMLSFLVNKAKQKLWEYGPTAKSVIDLEGIEIQYDVLQRYDCAGREGEVHDKAVHSAIRWLCINESDKVSYCRTKHLRVLQVIFQTLYVCRQYSFRRLSELSKQSGNALDTRTSS